MGSIAVINAYSGLPLDPMNISAYHIQEEDIAHSLSLICRGGGHLRHFYSVAQHCLNCQAEARARGLSRRVQLACLLHDASEAYIADLIRPVKVHLPAYQELERSIMAAVWRRFGLALSPHENGQWQQIDDCLLAWEMKRLLVGQEGRADPPMVSVPDLRERPWKDVEQQFLLRLGQLSHLTESEGEP